MLVHQAALSQARALYVEAMKLELDDQSRSCNEFFVDADAAPRPVVASLERIYDTVAAPAASTQHPAFGAEDADASDEEPPSDPVLTVDIAAAESYPLPVLSWAPPDVKLPIELHEMTELHDRFFFASLRALTLRLLSGEEGNGGGIDVVAGQVVLEHLKTELATVFRALWRANQERSKSYCVAVIDRVLLPLKTQFYDRDCLSAANPLSTKDGLRHWYNSLRSKIEEYCVKGRGGRKIDVLWDRINDEVRSMQSSAIAAGCDPEVVAHVGASVKKEIETMQRESMAIRNQEMLTRQRDAARVTVFVSADFSAQAKSMEATTLRRLLDDSRAWDMMTLAKRIRAFPALAAGDTGAMRNEEARARVIDVVEGEYAAMSVHARALKNSLPRQLADRIHLDPRAGHFHSPVVVRLFNAFARVATL